MTEDNAEHKPEYVLLGSGSSTKPGLKPAFREGSESRVSTTRIPKRLESLYILLADSQRDTTGLTLTREELDINPRTKSLSKAEKDALVKYWPAFSQYKQRTQDIVEGRAETTKAVLLAHRKAGAIRDKEGMANMTMPEQLLMTAKVFENQIQHAALALATMTVEDVAKDKLSRELFKIRVLYVREFAWIRDKITDLSERLVEQDAFSLEGSEIQDEAIALLQAADAALARKGAASEVIQPK